MQSSKAQGLSSSGNCISGKSGLAQEPPADNGKSCVSSNNNNNSVSNAACHSRIGQ